MLIYTPLSRAWIYLFIYCHYNEWKILISLCLVYIALLTRREEDVFLGFEAIGCPFEDCPFTSSDFFLFPLFLNSGPDPFLVMCMPNIFSKSKICIFYFVCIFNIQRGFKKNILMWSNLLIFLFRVCASGIVFKKFFPTLSS